MSQVSGAVSLDMGRVQREITAAVGAEVAKIVMPALVQLSDQIQKVSELIGAVVLRDDEVAPILAEHLPQTEVLKPLVIKSFAEFQTKALADSGYAIVAVSGPALQAARHTHRPAPGADLKAFVERQRAEHRADERLAQANRDGAEDSWFERDGD